MSVAAPNSLVPDVTLPILQKREGKGGAGLGGMTVEGRGSGCGGHGTRQGSTRKWVSRDGSVVMTTLDYNLPHLKPYDDTVDPGTFPTP